ncbi:MAG: DUF393 domain-containing protein [Chloroflexi bacterium]|nr:DUF393 domain-containing protein [Chloroflexota bacterium]
MMNRLIVLYDGVCNFCNAGVSFVVARDPEGRLTFEPLQSELGQTLLEKFGLSTGDSQTMVLVEGDRHYTRSSAALRIARRLKWPWPMLFGFMAVPPIIRDAVYNVIATNRYKWWGRMDSCPTPDPAVKKRTRR